MITDSACSVCSGPESPGRLSLAPQDTRAGVDALFPNGVASPCLARMKDKQTPVPREAYGVILKDTMCEVGIFTSRLSTALGVPRVWIRGGGRLFPKWASPRLTGLIGSPFHESRLGRYHQHLSLALLDAICAPTELLSRWESRRQSRLDGKGSQSVHPSNLESPRKRTCTSDTDALRSQLGIGILVCRPDLLEPTGSKIEMAP